MSKRLTESVYRGLMEIYPVVEAELTAGDEGYFANRDHEDVRKALEWLESLLNKLEDARGYSGSKGGAT